jgi:hypothetical protein
MIHRGTMIAFAGKVPRLESFCAHQNLTWPLPCRLWFADDGHVDRIDGSGDVHPSAIPDRRLVVVGRYVHDPALIARPAIVISFGGEGRARKAKHQNPNDKISSHGRSPRLVSWQLPQSQSQRLRRFSRIANWIGCLLASGCVENTTTQPRNPPIVVIRDSERGTETMRVLIICAIVITGAVGLSGCFHHEKAVTQEPLKLG